MKKLEGLSEKVFLDRYALKDKDGTPLESSPTQMWRRVAHAIAQQEKTKKKKEEWEEKFYHALEDFKFVPGGRILSGAGTGFGVTYYNCFVIPNPDDSRHGILKTLGQMTEIMARGGGVGFNISSLRPRGARVEKVNGFSSGPINWAELFSLTTKDIIQQGGTRRGALMLMLHDWHPDIEEFITVKEDLARINGANLSVCVSDKFMQAVKNDDDWQLKFPDTRDPMYDDEWRGDIDTWEEKGGKVIVYKTIKAKNIWELICTAAWNSAEPGLHFLERSNKRSNTWYFERLTATNPCGEQPLGEWAVCNLGAMNLAAYVKDKEFDFNAFGNDVKIAMRFLDNVIDDTHYFFKENEKVAKDIRRTGLGIMGIADALIQMELRYGDEESLPVIEKIFKTLRDAAYESSIETASEKGAFPRFDKEKYLEGYHIKNLPKKLRDGIAKHGIRNAVLLTVAPTGSTSLLSGVSSGIEPVYEFEFTRRDRLGEHKVYHPLFKAWTEEHPGEGRPEHFVSANDLTPLDHAHVQAIAQKYIDSSISKTVNAPKHHTVEQVKDLYMSAYDMGLKGVTYMRDGSREGVLSRVEEKEEEKPEVKENSIIKRPNVLSGFTQKIETPLGDTFITINSDETGNPFEIFVTGGKSGSDVMAMAEALGRMMSMVLRLHGQMDSHEKIRMISRQLAGIGGARTVGFGPNRVRSLPDAVAKVLAKHYTKDVDEEALNGNGHKATEESVESHANGSANGVKIEEPAQDVAQPMIAAAAMPPKDASFDMCPECGDANLIHEEGCKKCYSCGYSEC